MQFGFGRWRTIFFPSPPLDTRTSDGFLFSASFRDLLLFISCQRFCRLPHTLVLLPAPAYTAPGRPLHPSAQLSAGVLILSWLHPRNVEWCTKHPLRYDLILERLPTEGISADKRELQLEFDSSLVKLTLQPGSYPTDGACVFRIRAVNELGAGSFSNPLHFRCPSSAELESGDSTSGLLLIENGSSDLSGSVTAEFSSPAIAIPNRECLMAPLSPSSPACSHAVGLVVNDSGPPSRFFP